MTRVFAGTFTRLLRAARCQRTKVWNTEDEDSGKGEQAVKAIEAEEASDHEWLRAAAQGGGFEFLSAPEEDLYTLSDGRPFDDAR